MASHGKELDYRSMEQTDIPEAALASAMAFTHADILIG